MKALTFTQYYDDLLKMQSQKDIDPSTIDSMLRIYLEFVKKSFRPEMITEMFDGWSFLIPKSFKINNDYQIDFEYINMVILKIHGVRWYVFTTPTTLNDFISDCQRAGIELVFKEEISKHFLV